jgi:signal transduction histidine kinase
MVTKRLNDILLNRTTFFIFTLLIIIHLTCCKAPSASTSSSKLTLTSQTSRNALDGVLYAFKDNERAYSFSDVKNRHDLFKPALELPGNLVLSDDIYWIKFTALDTTYRDWTIRLSEPHVDFIHVYIPEPEKEHGYRSISYSTRDPYPGQKSKSRWFQFDLQLQKGEERTYYIHIDQAPLEKFQIWNTAELERYEYNYSFSLGIFFGLMLAIGIYAFFIFVSLRDISYLFFTGIVVGTFSFLSYYRVFSFHFLSPAFGDLGVTPSLILGNIGIISLFLFLVSFLNLKHYSPVLYKSGRILALISVFFFIPFFLSDRQFLMWTVLSVLTMVMGIYFIIALITALKHRFRPAWYLLIGMGAFIGTSLITGVLNMGLHEIGQAIDFDSSVLVSTSLLVIFFSLALSNKYRRFREERENALIEKARADRLNIRKTEFFINLAHEIKTPLTVIDNLLEIYIKQNPDADRELTMLRKNVTKLKRDMVHFFDLLRFEKGKIIYDHAQITLLSQSIENSCMLLKESAERKNIICKFDLQSDVRIIGDPAAVDRMISNLFDNALKYTPRGGIIRVRLSSVSDEVLFTVSNTGERIPDASIDLLFQPYYQLSRKKNNSQGIGLGLSIIKNIAEGLGGSINVESTEEGLTTFLLALPSPDAEELNRMQQQTEVVVPEPPPSSLSFALSSESEQEYETAKTGYKKLLIVEDNPDLLSLLTGYLSEHYDVYTAQNGAEALDLLQNAEQEYVPDLIITDIMMDAMDGFEFIEHLAGINMIKAVPVIILTVKTGSTVRAKGLKLGAVDFINKPFSFEELRLKIESLLLFSDLNASLHERDKYLTLGLFTGEIAHEIFNPLNTLLAPLDNLKRLIADSGMPVAAKAQKYITDMEKSIARIEGIVRTVRTLHTDNSFHKKQLVFRDILGKAEMRINAIYDKPVSFRHRFADGETVSSNETVLEQILFNLLRNAVEAVEEGGSILIALDRDIEHTDKKRLIVEDNGRGIDAALQTNLFRPLLTENRLKKGMGLGLFITSQMVMRLGGSIILDESYKDGSRFVITLEG